MSSATCRSPSPPVIAIVGGGASGVLVASHLLRAHCNATVTLIEKSGRVGAGVAYATTRAEHLLNVTAGGMSAFEDDPGDFVRFLCAQPGAQSPAALRDRYAQRRQFGAYLRDTLQRSSEGHSGHLGVVSDAVVAIEPGQPHRVQLRSGAVLQADAVVLALGNWPRRLPHGTPAPGAGSVLRGWDYPAIAAIAPDRDVMIAGSGLSMVDAVLTLASNRHRGAIHVASRHGLLPQAHTTHGEVRIDLEAFARLPLRQRVRHLRSLARRAAAAGTPWQWVMDALRQHNARLWQSLSPTDQQRFLRHAARQWDVHRHRIPRSAAATVQKLLATGQLQRHAARIAAVASAGNRLTVSLQPRRGNAHTLRADCLIDCIGIQPDLRKVDAPLVRNMFASGSIRRGPHGIGLATGAAGEVLDANGKPQPRMYALGSVRIGSLWESVAVPELRKQAAAIAARLLADGADG
ncbi:MAG TPA: FAD/NAD(P)-binding protein [Rhodanobacteraceae bacterium]